MCEIYGIQYIEQEESYTSKASALDHDHIPNYNPDNTAKYTFSGKRVKRGLYESKDGIKVNADVNYLPHNINNKQQQQRLLFFTKNNAIITLS